MQALDCTVFLFFSKSIQTCYNDNDFMIFTAKKRVRVASASGSAGVAFPAFVIGNASPTKACEAALRSFQRWIWSVFRRKEKKGGKASKKFLRPWRREIGKRGGVKHMLLLGRFEEFRVALRKSGWVAGCIPFESIAQKSMWLLCVRYLYR